MLVDLPSVVRRVLRKQLLIGPCSIDTVAAQFGMHRRTLDRRLQRHGVYYRDLLDAVRHEAACQLLRDTRLQVQQIAESLRYSSAANFSTAFRRWTGLSPMDFRRNSA
jgi:AraC-like DNA-binding protein